MNKRTKHSAPLDPLDYLLRVIGYPSATDARRDKLALAALPYCHAKVHDRVMTRKEKTARAVARVVNGDSNDAWGDVLRPKSGN